MAPTAPALRSARRIRLQAMRGQTHGMQATEEPRDDTPRRESAFRELLAVMTSRDAAP